MDKVVLRLLERENVSVTRTRGGALDEVVHALAQRKSEVTLPTRKKSEEPCFAIASEENETGKLQLTLEEGTGEGGGDEDQWSADDDLGFHAIRLSVEEFAQIEEAAGELRKEEDTVGVQNSGTGGENDEGREHEHIQLIGGRRNVQAKSKKKTRKRVGNSYELETINLPIVRPRKKTGFEDSKEFLPRPGRTIAGRYRITRFITESQFCFACECRSEQGGRVCAKIVKNDKTVSAEGWVMGKLT